jgi:hypothetical protein
MAPEGNEPTPGEELEWDLASQQNFDQKDLT